MNYNKIKSNVINSINKYVNNPLNKSIKCKLINNKKVDYYEHEYNPEPYLQQLRKIGFDDEILSRFNQNTRKNCCNIISITLYIKDITEDGYLRKALPSIYATIKNVEFNLPKWIVRLYLDKSVYECIKNIDLLIQNEKNNNKKDIYENENDKFIDKNVNIKTYYEKEKELFKKILESPNVEIYTFICKDFILEKTRSFRFLPMIEDDVNLYVFREADGIVSNLDCHNINIFEKSIDKLFYLVDFDVDYTRISKNKKNRIFSNNKYSAYSNWLKKYKRLEKVFYESKINIYDLLAGVFSCKLKITPEFYNNKIVEINELIKNAEEIQKIQNKNLINIQNSYKMKNKYQRQISYEENKNKINELKKKIKEYKNKIFNFNNKYPNGINKIPIDNLYVGFDEIFLLKIFEDIISIEFNENKKLKNNEKYEKINKLFLNNYSENIIIKTDFLNDKYEFNIEEFNNEVFDKLKEYINNNFSNKILNKLKNDSGCKEIFKHYRVGCNFTEIKFFIDLLFRNNNINDKYKNTLFNIYLYSKINHKVKENIYNLVNEPYLEYYTNNFYLENNIYSNNN